jgi:aerobic carbon-monoxide dehydrogenase medium subunit
VKAFTYLTPRGSTEAVGLLREHGADARVMAGGQSLLLTMKDRSSRPSVVISLAGVPELSGIRNDGDELVVGATTTYAQLSRADLPGWQAEIAAIAGNLADRPVRTMGTIGGALCAADPRFDMLTLVTGVDARLEVLTADGARVLEPASFFAPDGGTRLDPGGILVAVRFPAVSAFDGVAFEKFRQRTFDAALASVLCAVRIGPDGSLADLRITVGAVAPIPLVAGATAAAALGGSAQELDVVSVARDVVEETLSARGGSAAVEYSRELVLALTRRALTRALTTARS